MRMILEKLDAFLDWAVKPFECVAIGLLFVMLGANGLNILTRNLFGFSHEAVWPWTMTLFVWWIFFGFYPLYRKRKDVSVYVLLRFLPPALQRCVGVMVYFSIGVLMLLILAVMPHFIGLQAGLIEIVAIPRFWLSVPLVLALVFVALDAIVQACCLCLGLKVFEPFGKAGV